MWNEFSNHLWTGSLCRWLMASVVFFSCSPSQVPVPTHTPRCACVCIHAHSHTYNSSPARARKSGRIFTGGTHLFDEGRSSQNLHWPMSFYLWELLIPTGYTLTWKTPCLFCPFFLPSLLLLCLNNCRGFGRWPSWLLSGPVCGSCSVWFRHHFLAHCVR